MAEKPAAQALSIDDEDLQQILDDAIRPQSATIILLGKIGAGKSSLANCIFGHSTDAFKSKEGFKADERKAVKVCVPIGQVTLNIVDTHGMMDTRSDIYSEDIIKLAGAIATNEYKGLILVCIKMYERVDVSTLATLTTLHKKYGETIWDHVVIALTNADRYEDHKWLKSKKFGVSKQQFLCDKFEDIIQECKDDIKDFFTAEEKKVEESCFFGMKQPEFDKLEIPIIPTSQLDEYEMDRMKQVGHQYWFDVLLIKCCQRLQGCGLIQIHEKRLTRLPTELVVKEIGEQAFKQLQKSRKKLAIILGAIMYHIWHKYKYYKKAAILPRFVDMQRTERA